VQVAAALGLDVVMVAPGGLGSSFDLLSINCCMLRHHGVRVKGVILNKAQADLPLQS
jgi:phosphate acetyltransferase